MDANLIEVVSVIVVVVVDVGGVKVTFGVTTTCWVGYNVKVKAWVVLGTGLIEERPNAVVHNSSEKWVDTVASAYWVDNAQTRESSL